MWVETSAVGDLLTLKPCVGTGNTNKDFLVNVCFLTIGEVKANFYLGMYVYLQHPLPDLREVRYKIYAYNAVELG